MKKKLIYLLAPVVLGQSAAALAQDKPAGYPTRPIRIIISVAPGAGSDMVARMTSEVISKAWGQNVVVESRPGGGGVVASGIAARAEPNGYTLLQNGFSLLMQGAAKRVEFDILKTFQPVVRSTEQPYILVAQPGVTANSVKELIALSQKKELTYSGSSGIGSAVHIGMSQLAKEAGLKIKYLWAPAKTPRPVVAALNKVVSDGLNSPEYTKRLQAVGSDSADWASPDDLKKQVASEYAELEVAIKELGLKL
ncbi:MAG: hypothetical protein GEV05_16395 [Betaproteobacteria bacterium]|nr:hypothetical protein [Betaproteobacteria bacterium]